MRVQAGCKYDRYLASAAHNMAPYQLNHTLVNAEKYKFRTYYRREKKAQPEILSIRNDDRAGKGVWKVRLIH